MPRRRSSGLGDLLTLAAAIPWWLSVVLALATFIGLHMLAAVRPDPHAVKSVTDLGQHIRASYIQTFASLLQYIIPAAFLLGACVRLIRKRISNRGNTASTPEAFHDTSCPNCGASMVKRKAKRGANAGSDFWGCSAYPKCKGTRPATAR